MKSSYPRYWLVNPHKSILLRNRPVLGLLLLECICFNAYRHVTFLLSSGPVASRYRIECSIQGRLTLYAELPTMDVKTPCGISLKM